MTHIRPDRLNLGRTWNPKLLKVKRAKNYHWGLLMCSKYGPSIQFENICYCRLRYSYIIFKLVKYSRGGAFQYWNSALVTVHVKPERIHYSLLYPITFIPQSEWGMHYNCARVGGACAGVLSNRHVERRWQFTAIHRNSLQHTTTHCNSLSSYGRVERSWQRRMRWRRKCGAKLASAKKFSVSGRNTHIMPGESAVQSANSN